MNYIKKAVTTLGGIFLAALLIAALAPKATHAVVAALVQVANTSAQAVPTRDVGPANEPFFAAFCASYSGDCAFSPIASGFTVPTNTVDGKTVTRLVVEDVSGVCASNGAGLLNAFLSTNLSTPTENLIGGQNSAALFVPTGSVLSTKESGPGTLPNEQTFSQPARFYAEPGDVLSLNYTIAANVTDSTCSANIEGYLVTQ